MFLKKVEIEGYRAAGDGVLECELPGRFAVLAGPNSGGKTTVSDSILLTHRDVFPRVGRPGVANLSAEAGVREISVEYSMDDDSASPLAAALSGQPTLAWRASLSPSMGRVRSSLENFPLNENQLPVLHLSPVRDPVRDLGGSQAWLVVEALKAEALRATGDRSLGAFRGMVQELMGKLLATEPALGTETRIADRLRELTDGTRRRSSFMAGSGVDDTTLARLLEFVMAQDGGGRFDARRLEVEGLGYANLLQIAVVLAAIPDLAHEGAYDPAEGSPEPPAEDEDGEAERSEDEMRAELSEAQLRRLEEDGSLFARSFHAVIVLEEPEAHLQPQLQHALITHLRSVVDRRPELQVIITTHSDQVIAACDPEHLVLFGQDGLGRPSPTSVASLGLSPADLRNARRHLDASRSASIFADSSLLVEGITDAITVRAFGRRWANTPEKRRFIEALPITAVGSRVGSWIPNLLCTPGKEIVRKVAVLADSDGSPPPDWVAGTESDRFLYVQSNPTLEPSLVDANPQLVADIVSDMSPGWTRDESVEAIANYFRETGRKRKADFAERIAAACEESTIPVEVPENVRAVLDFLWDGHQRDPHEVAEP